MALTKKQKSEILDAGTKKIGESRSLVFAEFNGVLMEDFRKLRRELKKAGADLQVLKKRLLNIALKNSNISFDSMAVKTQIGTIFSKSDLAGIAGIIHKFSKDLIRAKKGGFTVMGAYDFEEKRTVDPNEFKAIATLPSREVLLAQIVMMLTMPLKQMMMVLNEKAKKS